MKIITRQLKRITKRVIGVMLGFSIMGTGLSGCYYAKSIQSALTEGAKEAVTSIPAVKNGNDKVGNIVRVKDGDTYVIRICGKEKTVRLIGVDTPESVANNGKLKNTNWGKKSSNYAKQILTTGKKVWLTYDKTKTDAYGRVLAYISIKQNGKKVSLNKLLLKKGYARAVYYSPNGKYRKEFKNLHLKAKRNKVGFWKDGFKKAFPTKNEREY